MRFVSQVAEDSCDTDIDADEKIEDQDRDLGTTKTKWQSFVHLM